jgi:hypothetical protein
MHVDAQRAERKRTRTKSNQPTPAPDNSTSHAPATSDAPTAATHKHPVDVTKVSDDDLANFLESITTTGFKWGCLADDEFDANYPDDPTSLEEALASEDAPKWLAGCREELMSIEKMKVFNLVPQSQAGTRKILKNKLVFRVKRNGEGIAVRWKVRLVVKGYEAVYGVDYNKTTSPTM